jgi:hypothetical protein
MRRISVRTVENSERSVRKGQEMRSAALQSYLSHLHPIAEGSVQKQNYGISDRRQKWQRYRQTLEKRAIEQPIEWVLATVCFAFITGLNATCAVFGKLIFHPFNPLLALYAVGTASLFTILLAGALVSALRHRQSDRSADELRTDVMR